jgi:hypothetical protein
MKKRIFVLLITGLGIFGIVPELFGQGCSDAGVCSIGGMNSGLSGNVFKSTLVFSHSFGIAENFTLVQKTQLEGRFEIFNKSYINARIPFQFSTGNLGNSGSIGDIALSFSQEFAIAEHRAMITLGGIVPTNDSDISEGGRDLPMDYQSSLGSYDLIIGGSYFFKTWQISIGYQHPLNRNKNGFLHSQWLDNEDALDYFESNQLKRGDDLILRIEKRYDRPRSTIYIGVLPIVRLQKDEIIKNGSVVKLMGSSGLTFNLNFTMQKSLSDRLNFRLGVGGPLIFRETRADGLTRALVVSLGLYYRL